MGESGTLSVTAADPNSPITQPQTTDVPGDSADLAGKVLVAEGDGNLLFTLTYNVRISRYNPETRQVETYLCSQTSSKTVQAGRGTVPRLLSVFRVERGVRFNFDGPRSFRHPDCVRYAPVPLAVELTGSGGSRRVAIPDLCARRYTERGRSKTFRLVPYEDGDVDFVHPKRKRSSVHRYGYVVRVGNQVKERGRITARTRYARGGPIFESHFDDYVNFCINENRRVYANNGRLYCWYPGSVYMSIKLRRGR